MLYSKKYNLFFKCKYVKVAKKQKHLTKICMALEELMKGLCVKAGTQKGNNFVIKKLRYIYNGAITSYQIL